MKRLFFITTLLLMGWAVKAQPPAERVFFSSGGGSNSQMPVSMGEVFVGSTGGMSVGSQQNGTSSPGVAVKQIQTAQNRIVLFPNPATDEVNVQVIGENENNFTLFFYNSLGQEISAQHNVALQGKISLVGLASGAYMVTVSDATGKNLISKLVIKQ